MREYFSKFLITIFVLIGLANNAKYTVYCKFTIIKLMVLVVVV